MTWWAERAIFGRRLQALADRPDDPLPPPGVLSVLSWYEPRDSMSENGVPFNSGAIVEVRSADEIAKTLDANGTLEGVPFMEEMRRFCGRRFRVFKRADKICVERPH